MTGWATMVPPTLIRAFDRFIAEEAPGMSRPDALCRALQEWASPTCAESSGFLSDARVSSESNQ
jgi:hypothetical protein